MSRALIPTHAGDDSDGRIWGLEGINILFVLAGLVLSIGLSLLLFRQQPPAVAFGMGSLPFVVATGYVLALRQGRPRSFDNDLLETLATGSGWSATLRPRRNPLHESA